ncbi:alpha/beta hydrolase [Hymenobacter busanensis]|uniref:Alpha/beta hydrolase n=1 Tax=Hymenobacter busanensis TaxID=2607656 RepID=A0A7L4ZVN9_9BACT|nr:alpha/beta hydrolase [Hymenobacter busanensis]KAA9339322.1 alpha/beta hydrolase [Hymenobacter busanensis]QHJ06916.1 alpha/beta hydrolase [Hymenobacter busanensis]
MQRLSSFLLLAYGLAGLLLASCAHRPRPTAEVLTVATGASATPLTLFDEARNRAVPVTLYAAANQFARGTKTKLALLSHGYGGHSTDYSFIAHNLVAHGYTVASVQHELPTDEPLPTTGNPQVVRRPNWERGVQNLLFVRRKMLKAQPDLDADHLLLAGHSNGGDISMLFAHEHPALVEKVISLDNRRMPLPRTRQPRILALRSSDQPADAGVLPTMAEQAALGIRVVQLPATAHNDMWDGATEAQKQEINAFIDAFLVP